MASLLQKLLAKRTPTNIISTFSKSQASNLALLFTLLHRDSHLAETEPHHLQNINLTSFSDPPETGDSVSSLSRPIFPSFPFGFSLNPSPSTGFLPPDAEVVSGDSQTIWADSVKKKRKKKMNKHKYNKLRKRLRHH